MSVTVNPLTSLFGLTVKTRSPDNASSKLKEARKLGIKILTEEQLFRPMKTKTPESEIEWAAQANCNDQAMGRIGLFSLLRLIASADGGHGYITIHKGVSSTVLFALNEADPKMVHWCVTEHTDYIKVWRRKEWNEAYEKVIADKAKKSVAILNEQEYQEAKATVINFFLELFDGNRKVAEAMFAPMANNHEKLVKKANAIRNITK